MNLKPEKTYEFTVRLPIFYNVQGTGRNELEARQDAMERFHRLRKSKELAPYDTGKPTITLDSK